MKTKEFKNELLKVLTIFDYSFIYYYYGKVTPQFDRVEHFALVHFTDEFGRNSYGLFMNDSNEITKEIKVVSFANYNQAKKYLKNVIL